MVGTVTTKDSSSPAKDKIVTIAADGKYTVDVSDLTLPLMMRADGQVGGRSYSLYSAATSADIGATVNITPLTDLIVANIAGQVAATLYNSGNFSGMTQAALNQAETQLQQRLQPVLDAVGLSALIDLLRTTFNADHTGLDEVLDILRVTVDPTTLQATIQNTSNNQQIVDDLASQTDATVLPAGSGGGGATGVSADIDVTNATPASGNTNINSGIAGAIVTTASDTLNSVPVTRVEVTATTDGNLRKVLVYFATATGAVQAVSYSWGTASLQENIVSCPNGGCTGVSVDQTAKTVWFSNTALDNHSPSAPADKFATLPLGGISYP